MNIKKEEKTEDEIIIYNKFVNIATDLPSWNTSSRKIIEVKFLKIQFFIHK